MMKKVYKVFYNGEKTDFKEANFSTMNLKK